MTMQNLSIFNLLKDNLEGEQNSIESTETSSEKISTETEEVKSTSSKSSKLKKNTKKEPKLQNQTEKIEQELKEYLEVEIKVFGSTVKTLTDKEEIESISLSAIKSNLIEMGYHELAAKVSWLIIPNSDKTKAVLTIIPQFQNKG